MRFLKYLYCLQLVGLFFIFGVETAHSTETDSIIPLQKFSLSGSPYLHNRIYFVQNTAQPAQNGQLNQNTAPGNTDNALKNKTSPTADGGSPNQYLPANFQPPMKNVFLNTLFGAITGAFLGIGVNTLESQSNATLSSVTNASLIGASVGAIIGCGIGVFLSQNNLYFSKQSSILNRKFSEGVETKPSKNLQNSITLSYRF